MGTSNVKSNTLQVIEAASEIVSVTNQTMLSTTGTSSAKAMTKLLILGPPAVTTTKSNALQIIEADNPEIISVTNQTMLVPIGGTEVQALTQTLILQSVQTVNVSNVKLEVIGQSTITPPLPGQRVTWFNS